MLVLPAAATLGLTVRQRDKGVDASSCKRKCNEIASAHRVINGEQRGELAACKTLASLQARVRGALDDHQSLAIRFSINYFA